MMLPPNHQIPGVCMLGVIPISQIQTIEKVYHCTSLQFVVAELIVIVTQTTVATCIALFTATSATLQFSQRRLQNASQRILVLGDAPDIASASRDIIEQHQGRH